MYGIFTYIWLIFLVNVDYYTINGSCGHMICYLLAFLGSCSAMVNHHSAWCS